MFKCQVCGAQVPAGVRSKLLITKTRERVYSREWVRALNTPENKEGFPWRKLEPRKKGRKREGKARYIEVFVPQHVGWEIVEEKRAYPACARGHRFERKRT